MKKIMLLSTVLSMFITSRLSAQSEEVQQLLLNVEKLAQFKQILSDLKKGYQIINVGYSTIKDLSQGNFNLHKTFLDGLMTVSPTVKKYKRIADIINQQKTIVKEYKSAYSRFKKEGNLNLSEIEYLGRVYSKLFRQSLNDLDELVVIITDNKLRMSDDERLEAIDRIYGNVQDKLLFLRHFNNNTTILAIQRAKAGADAATMKIIYGVTN